MNGGLRQVQQAVRQLQEQIAHTRRFIENNLIPITEWNRKTTLENERNLKALEQRVQQDEEDLCRVGDRLSEFLAMTFWERLGWLLLGSLPVRFHELERRKPVAAPVAVPIAPPAPELREMPPDLQVEEEAGPEDVGQMTEMDGSEPLQP